MPEWETLTVHELAERLQVNPQTVRNWITTGDLESFKVGRSVRIPRQVVVAMTGGEGWDIPELLTVAQTAERLRLVEQTIYNWIDRGELPAVRIGRLIRIKQAVVDEVLAGGLKGLQPPEPTATDFWLGTEPVGSQCLPRVRSSHNSGLLALRSSRPLSA